MSNNIFNLNYLNNRVILKHIMTSVKMLEVHMPDNKITNEFIKLTKEKRELCIKLGIDCLKGSDVNVEKFYNQEVSVIREDGINKFNELETKLEKQKTEHIIDLENLSKRVYKQTKLEQEEVIKELHNTVNEKNDKMFKLQSTIESEKRNEAESFNAKMINELNKKNEDSRKREDKIREEYEKKLQEERDKNNKLEILKNNSSLKGKQGEQEMEQILNSMFPKAEVTMCSSEGKRGDFNVVEDKMYMMIDVKNYTKNVQKVEIEKFHRDMKENPQYTCGVLISMSSGVCAKDDMSIDIVNERPILYLHNFSKNTNKMKYALQVIKMIHTTENLNLKDQETINFIKVTQKELKKDYITSKKDLDKFYKKMTTNLEKHEGLIKRLFDCFLGKIQ